ncbi:MAG: MarR family transcriptional regulator [Phycisphaeraceae bacterium]|nr:MarR family transcriptional regulator [Phycisphaeraceae bacterium]
MGVCRIPKPKDPVAAARAEVVELLFSYVERLRSHFESVAVAHDLTAMQAKVLMFLGDDEPMRCVADNLGCDPSNITGVVDRLQDRGLLTRSEDPQDRRVKILHATPAGKRLRETIGMELFRDVPGMSTLSPSRVAELRSLLSSLCADSAEKQSIGG